MCRCPPPPSSGGDLTAVGVKTGATFQASAAARLFSMRLSGVTDTRTYYAVAADGWRFLVNTVKGRGGSPAASRSS